MIRRSTKISCDRCTTSRDIMLPPDVDSFPSGWVRVSVWYKYAGHGEVEEKHFCSASCASAWLEKPPQFPGELGAKILVNQAPEVPVP